MLSITLVSLFIDTHSTRSSVRVRALVYRIVDFEATLCRSRTYSRDPTGKKSDLLLAFPAWTKEMLFVEVHP